MHNIQTIRTGGITGFRQVLGFERGKVNITTGKINTTDLLGNIWGRYTEGGGLMSPLYTAMSDLNALWTGTGEEKANIVSDLITGSEESLLGTTTQDVLEEEYGTGGILVTPNLFGQDTAEPYEGLQIPDIGSIFGGLGKTLLIGAAVIGGLYLAGKYLGRSKSK